MLFYFQAITSLDRVADDIIAQRDMNDEEMGGNTREYDDLILDQTQVSIVVM